MNTGARNEGANQGSMRRTGVLMLVLLMMTLPITAVGAFARTEGDESPADVAVVRARAGQYLAVARSGEPELDVAVIRARLGQYLKVASEEAELFSLTSGVDPMGPVHGGGYNALTESGLFALTSGVDPSGPVHGSSLTCLDQSELDLLC
jgi:hypothetical protein